MWIGPDVKMIKFKDPATGVGATNMRWGVSGTFLGGGGFSRESHDSHREYELSWPFLRSHEVAQLEEVFSVTGIDETSSGILNLWIATEYQVNAMSRRASAPGMSLPKHLLSERVRTPANNDNLPAYGRKFGSEETYRIGTIPPGVSFQFEWWGAGNIQLRSGGGTLTDHAPYTKHTQRPAGMAFWMIVPAGTTVYGVRLVLDMPPTQGFAMGRGNSGVKTRGDNPPAITQYSAPGAANYESVTASFIETGDWNDLYN